MELLRKEMSRFGRSALSARAVIPAQAAIQSLGKALAQCLLSRA
jgi:hypothetical protein